MWHKTHDLNCGMDATRYTEKADCEDFSSILRKIVIPLISAARIKCVLEEDTAKETRCLTAPYSRLVWVGGLVVRLVSFLFHI